MNNIDNAIAQATAAAANIPQDNAQQHAGGTAVAPASQSAGAVAVGRPLGLDDAMAGAVVVDEWLKVNEHGLQIGAKKPLLEEIKVRIDLSDVAYTEVVKYGNPATYRKTNDRVMAQDGATWAQALSEARSVDPKARPYRSADINMELLDDVKLKDETVPAGTTLGHGFSTTGFKSFAKLVKQMTKDGADPANDTIEVTVGYLEQASNGNTWGILDFRDYKVVG
ncbi:MAG: hypothetical protein EOR34_10755 [Mesorhizobium sp.]|uniref:hypothetical protein n=1 Tax=Mesorhizobium sp. TaxID=1871066 RepID=UPI000FE4CA19|nr:hypothetical protein [Mesorhizobium sp.]RWI48379.1 MAG: hypothetical protein EOR15_13535 [Mesorhizobium sp.]RWI88130.1 MAG: hypothetical protein EOR20_03590 [Mesorhizobium sp.]RWJ60112.1 MAG: hypothetical protein EOR32_19675 [Mesorhizobium sp.]RWJ74362.1 MAG: hypothetical protein EOR34_10755 [Mesorhizobium sp.]